MSFHLLLLYFLPYLWLNSSLLRFSLHDLRSLGESRMRTPRPKHLAVRLEAGFAIDTEELFSWKLSAPENSSSPETTWRPADGKLRGIQKLKTERSRIAKITERCMDSTTEFVKILNFQRLEKAPVLWPFSKCWSAWGGLGLAAMPQFLQIVSTILGDRTKFGLWLENTTNNTLRY